MIFNRRAFLNNPKILNGELFKGMIRKLPKCISFKLMVKGMYTTCKPFIPKFNTPYQTDKCQITNINDLTVESLSYFHNKFHCIHNCKHTGKLPHIYNTRHENYIG